MMSYRLLIAGLSERHTRNQNQDRIFPFVSELPLYQDIPTSVGIADGMGGTQDGAKAAQIAIEHLDLLKNPTLLQEYIQQTSLRDMISHEPLQSYPQLLEYYFQYVNYKIIQEAGASGKIGTTLSLLNFEKEDFWIGHVGDCRIYRLQNSTLQQLTDDDNLFARYLSQGYLPFSSETIKLSPKDLEYLQKQQLEKQDFFYFSKDINSNIPHDPQKQKEYLSNRIYNRVEELMEQGEITLVGASKDRLSLALGKRYPLPQNHIARDELNVEHSTLKMGDLFLLASDGLCGYLPEQKLQQRLIQIQQQMQTTDPDPALLSWGCDMLFEDARSANSNDNVSIVLVFVCENPIVSSLESSHQSISHISTNSFQSTSEKAMDSFVVMDASLPEFPQEISFSKDEQSDHYDTSTTNEYNFSSLDSQHIETTSHQDIPAKVRTFLTTKERLSWSILSSLLLLLALWAFFRIPTKNTPNIAHLSKKNTPSITINDRKGLTALFLLKLPKVASQDVEKKIEMLSLLNRQYSSMITLWRFPAKKLESLKIKLSHPDLSASQILKMLRKTPFEMSNLAAFDRALNNATFSLLSLLTPSYLHDLNEMNQPLALPSFPSIPQLTSAFWQNKRQKMVLAIIRKAKQNQIHSWIFPLLKEQLFTHPYQLLNLSSSQQRKKKQDITRQLRFCLQLLKSSYHQLMAFSPRHPSLPELNNRIKLHEKRLKFFKK